DQVRFMLGTPLLTSSFHSDRWDYIYYLNRRSGEVQNRKLTLLFQDGKLASFTADEMPTETAADQLILGRDATKIEKPRPVAPARAPEAGTPAPSRE
ncbi:MAG: outer membrane protein assembly factor BamE, partial [Burkholderiaceae bacterium]